MKKREWTTEQLKKFRDEYPYNDEGFFSLKGYIEECVGLDWKQKAFSMIIQAERNMGKSYGTWDFIEKEIWIKSNYQERVVYMRTNMTKLKPVKSFFNSKYRGKYLMTDTHIWKIELDNEGREIKEKRIELGVVLGVMNEENFRSGEFYNYRMIFWDEYNETNQYNGLFEHWVNACKTIERMMDNTITLMVGNKIDANNDILVKLEIEIPELEKQENDFLLVKKDKFGREKIFFVDIAPSTFAHLGQEGQLANIWASYDEKTDTFLNRGGYLNQQSKDVLIYRTRILPTRVIKWYVAYQDKMFEYGTFERGVYFKEVYETQQGYKVLALDALGGIMCGAAKGMYDKSDYEELGHMLALKSKSKQLFYDSFESKRHLEKFIVKHTSLYNL